MDRGRIQAGRRADLLMIKADPTKDIRATRDILRVWMAGMEINRKQVAKIAEASRKTQPHPK
jgi:imidazolonepropionase-like amidohydrolase